MLDAILWLRISLHLIGVLCNRHMFHLLMMGVKAPLLFYKIPWQSFKRYSLQTTRNYENFHENCSTIRMPPARRRDLIITHYHRFPVQQAPNGQHFSWKADCIATSNRTDTVLLAHLRSGLTPFLKAYAHLLNPTTNPT